MRKQVDRDGFTLDGAMVLAGKIRRFWQERCNFDVSVWVEPIKVRLGTKEAPIVLYQVRSNLVNALPPR